MKNTLNTIGIVGATFLLIGSIFKMQHWPGGGISAVLGVFILTVIYFPGLTISGFQTGKNPLQYLLGSIMAILLLLGVIFKIQHWPGASIVLFSSLIATVLLLPVLSFSLYTAAANKTVILAQITIGFTAISLIYLAYTGSINSSKVLAGGISAVNSELNTASANYITKNNLIKQTYSYNLKINAIGNASTELINHISNLKSHLIQQVDGLPLDFVVSGNIADVVNKNNFDIPTRILFGDNPNKPKSDLYSALELKLKINNYREFLINQFDDDSKHSIELGIALTTNDYTFNSGQIIPWENALFYHAPISTVITALSKLENDVHTAEMQALLQVAIDIESNS